MYLPRLIARNHAEAVAAFKERRAILLAAAANALDLAEKVNRDGDPAAAGGLIAEAQGLYDRAQRLAPVA